MITMIFRQSQSRPKNKGGSSYESRIYKKHSETVIDFSYLQWIRGPLITYNKYFCEYYELLKQKHTLSLHKEFQRQLSENHFGK